MDTQETQEAEQAWANLAAQGSHLDNENNPALPVNENQPVNNEPDIETAELLAPVIQITADIFAPNWEINEDECEQLATVYGALIDKYLPDNPATKYGLEISALITTAMIFGARKGKPLTKEKPKADKNKIENLDKTGLSGGIKVPGQDEIINDTKNGVLMPKAVTNE